MLLGIVVAAVLLVGVTLLRENVDSGISRVGQTLCYLAAVGVGTLIGGRRVALVVVPVATAVADYYVTYPKYALSVHADDVLFLLVAAAVSALAIIAARNRRQGHVATTIAQAVDDAFRQCANAHAWSAVYEEDGDEYVIWAPGQPATVTAQQLADGAHEVACPGCDRCSSLPVVA
jgi:K+-sensing histidine kinase KdpD